MRWRKNLEGSCSISAQPVIWPFRLVRETAVQLIRKGGKCGGRIEIRLTSLRREQFSNDIKNGAHIESVRNARNSRHLSIAIQSGVRLMRAPGKMLNARPSPPNNNAIWPHRAIWSVLMTFQRDRGQCIGHVKITDPTLVVRF